MKKIIFIVVVAALSAGATAQIKFGIQVGGNLANIKGEQTESGTTTKGLTKPKFGLLAGVVAEVSITGAFSLRPEFNFIQKGYNLNYNQTDPGGSLASTGDGTFNFIELPLNFVYNIPLRKNTMFFGIGPSVGYGLSGKFKYTVITTTPGFPPRTRSGNGYVKFDGKKDSDSQSMIPEKTSVDVDKVAVKPPLPVQTNDDPRGHVGAQDEQVDHTLTPPAPEESVEKVSN